MNDLKLMLLVLALHLVALVAGGGLLLLALHGGDGTYPLDNDSDEGGGGIASRRGPPLSPFGGPPLPDAEPSRVRLRQSGRLADAVRPRRRRGPWEQRRPSRPVRRID
jgi:hypothetical protein